MSFAIKGFEAGTALANLVALVLRAATSGRSMKLMKASAASACGAFFCNGQGVDGDQRPLLRNSVGYVDAVAAFPCPRPRL